jgi:hypothetical protein
MRALCDAEMNARGGPLLPMKKRGDRRIAAAKKPAGKQAGAKGNRNTDD